LEVLGNIFWIPFGHKCRHTATTGLCVEWCHCAHLRPCVRLL